MPMRRPTALSVAAALLLCAAGPLRAETAIEADNHTELRDAIAATQGRVVIELAPGVHRIDRPIRATDRALTIRGGGDTVIDGGALKDDEPAIVLRSSTPGALRPGVSLEGLRFRGTTALGRAGSAVMADGVDLALRDCSFDTALAAEGGAVAVRGGSLVVRGGTFSASTATRRGGAIFVHGADLVDIASARFDGCEAAEAGGAIALVGVDRAALRGLRITNARAADGGAIALFDAPDATLEACGIAGARASIRGGAVYAEDAVLAIDHTTFSGCRAPRGGAVAAGRGTVLTVFHTAMSENAARLGADLAADEHAIAVIENSILWSGTPAVDAAPGAVVLADHAIVRGGFSGLAVRVLNVNPRFADPLGPDGLPGTGDESFTLQQGSPAIDAGNNTLWTGGRRRALTGRLHQDRATPDTGLSDGLLAVVDLGPAEFTGSGPRQPPLAPTDLPRLLAQIEQHRASADTAVPFGVVDSGDVLHALDAIAAADRNP